MNNKSLSTLEYNKIISRLVSFACSDGAKQILHKLEPMSSSTTIRQEVCTAPCLPSSIRQERRGTGLSKPIGLSRCSLLRSTKRTGVCPCTVMQAKNVNRSSIFLFITPLFIYSVVITSSLPSLSWSWVIK